MQVDYDRFHRAKLDGTLAELVKNDSELLIAFDAHAFGFGYGIQAAVYDTSQEPHRSETISFNCLEWAWLRPLLEELLAYREQNAHTTTNPEKRRNL